MNRPVMAGDGMRARAGAIDPAVAVIGMKSEKQPRHRAVFPEARRGRPATEVRAARAGAQMIGEALDCLLAADAEASGAVGSDPARRRPSRHNPRGSIT